MTKNFNRFGPLEDHFRDIISYLRTRGPKVDFIKVEKDGKPCDVYETHPGSIGDYTVEFKEPFPNTDYTISFTQTPSKQTDSKHQSKTKKS